MFGWLATIALGVDLFALTLLVLLGVLPLLAGESPRRRAVLAWSDQWLPLILALPWAAAVLSAGDALDRPHSIWFVAAPLAATAAIAFAITALAPPVRVVSDPNCPDRLGATWRQGLMLAGIGVLLFIAAGGDRLEARHGQILITMAIVWLWVCAAARPAATSAIAATDSLNSTIAASSSQTTALRRRFLVDWSGELSRPVQPRVKLALAAAIGLAATISWWSGAMSLAAIAGLVAIHHLIVFSAAAFIVGAGFAQRLIASTLIISTLLGVGLAAVTRLAVTLPIWYGDDGLAPIRPSHILGVSALRSTGVLIMAMGVLGLLRYRSTSFFSSAVVAATLLVAATIVLLSGSEDALEMIAGGVELALRSILIRTAP